MDKEIMKREAISRMMELGILKQTIKDFEKENIVNLSETIGMLYWLDDEQKKMVKEFEDRTGNLVYHVERSFTNFGEMLTCLYVSTYKEDWRFERPDKNHCMMCFVINVDNSDFSEYGSCQIVPMNGGVKRRF